MIYQNTFQMAEPHTETNISCFHYLGGAGDGYPLHFHTHYELSYVIRGERYEFYNGQNYRVGSGSLFFLTPLSIHGNENITPVEDVVIQFSMDYLRSASYEFQKDTAILLKDINVPFYQLPHDSVSEHLLLQLTDASVPSSDQNDSLTRQISLGLKRTGLIFQIISALMEEDFLLLEPHHASLSQMTQMDQLLHEIFEDPAHIPDMQTAAHRLGLSYYRFSRLFKKVTGFGYTAYCNLLRLQYTEHLLANTNLSVNDVAAKIGIDTASYFSRFFKKHYGISPLQFRKEHQIRS